MYSTGQTLQIFVIIIISNYFLTIPKKLMSRNSGAWNTMDIALDPASTEQLLSHLYSIINERGY